MSENFRNRLIELPGYLSNHMRITVIALLVGVLISVPLAVFIARRKRLRYPLLTSAGVIQTIPSLALLALMVPLLDQTGGLGLGLRAFGFWPAVIALTLYSILPILRNTVTGIAGVDAAMIEAARAVGMTERQLLMKVQLPLATPVIIAGIRTATVWVVGIATLATPVGQTCLGNYIFTGLQTRNWLMVWFGVIGAAALAIVLDLLIGGLQRAAEERKRTLGFVSTIGLAIVIIGGVLAPDLVRWMNRTERDGPVVRIGAKTFTEQYILAALLSNRLADAGFTPRQTDSLGSTIIFEALASGELDVYVDYSGTIWANHMKRADVLSPDRVLSQMTEWLEETHGIHTLGSLGFENAYALVMRRDHAEQLDIRTIADLAEHAPTLTIGGDYEFFGRPEWEQMQVAYGLRFAEQSSYDSSLMYRAVADGYVDVISAFSSDGRIAAFDLLVLDDPMQVIPPYDAVLLLSRNAASKPEIVNALEPLFDAIPDELMREANKLVDVDGEPVSAAARMLDQQISSREPHGH